MPDNIALRSGLEQAAPPFGVSERSCSSSVSRSLKRSPSLHVPLALTSAISARTSFIFTGFVKYVSTPESKEIFLDAALVTPVIATIVVRASFCFRSNSRILAVAWLPSMIGMEMSVRIMKYREGVEVYMARASAPLMAVSKGMRSFFIRALRSCVAWKSVSGFCSVDEEEASLGDGNRGLTCMLIGLSSTKSTVSCESGPATWLLGPSLSLVTDPGGGGGGTEDDSGAGTSGVRNFRREG